jgi:trans-aconitate 2-methyltransferase
MPQVVAADIGLTPELPTVTDQNRPWDPRLYDDRHAFVWRFGASLVELSAPQPGERIVDLGCGTGRLTAEIAAAGANVLGLDASAAMIDEARRLYPAIRFDVADARSFRVDEPVDGVFSNAVLHWIRPPEQVVQRVRQALRPGGRFVAEFGGKDNCRQLRAALTAALAEFGLGPDVLPDWYYPSIAEYAGLLEREGLEPTTALLFDRPTPLEGPDGLRNWVTMFARGAVNAVAEADREPFWQAFEAAARPALYRHGGWIADYRRLRIVAVRPTT